MDVHVEVPTIWLLNKVDGAHHRQMFAALMLGLSRRNFRLRLEELSGERKDFVPRRAPAGGFALCYHCVGEVRNVWRIKESAVLNYYLFDRSGYSGWADIALHYDRHAKGIAAFDARRARQLVKQLREEFVQRNQSKYQQPDHEFRLSEPYLFMPLQRRTDQVSQLHRLDSIDVLREAARVAERRHRHLVVKRHPLCDDVDMEKALEDVTAGSAFVHATTASVHRIIAGCNAVLVANSGVGFEALIHGKPVSCFGSSEYGSVTRQLSQLSEVESCFDSSAVQGPEQVNRFIGYFLEQVCFNSLRIATLMPKLDRAINEARRAPARQPMTHG